MHLYTKILIIFAFFESFRVHLIKKVKILMMSAKSATLGLLKIKACRNKGYDAISFVHDVTNKTLSYDSNCTVDAVIWKNLAFLWEKLSQQQFYKDLNKKNFLEPNSWLKINKLGLSLGMALKLNSSLAKGSKLKIKNFWGFLPTFVEVAGGKT